MALRVEQGQALGERQWRIVQWRDQNLAFLNGQAYPLMDTQPGCACDCQKMTVTCDSPILGL